VNRHPLAAMTDLPRPRRIALLLTPQTYRAGSFIDAADRLGLEVVRVLDLPEPLAEYWRVELGLDFTRPEEAADHLVGALRTRPDGGVDAILAVDDSGTLVAAQAAAQLGLPHNDPASALAARDKFVMRERLAAGGVPVPAFRRFPGPSDPLMVAAEVARAIGYPVVVKPTRLSGSRGVIRADDPDQMIAAFNRTLRILVDDGHGQEETELIVEAYLPGVEVALEGLLTGGELRVLALFDKPDPLDGPFFEETIYVTPSRLPVATQDAIATRTAEAAAALGLREGPVHAELRINERGVWPIELAGRSIGGLCSIFLEFGTGISLEELILRHAVGLDLPDTTRDGTAAGVMMIPIPKAGLLKTVHGVDDACAVPGVTGVEITAKLNHPIVPLPEGAAYLGFVFARADTPADAEAALREAHARLRFDIRPTISLPVGSSRVAHG
jgi:biotin carboxylase